MEFKNCYADEARAAAYAKLEFPGTYYLAYRDLPEIIRRHVPAGRRAVDFGCGTGRSTRFLQRLGFAVVGFDIAADMIDRARALDAQGDYRLIAADNRGRLAAGPCDLVLSVFTFDNIPTLGKKVRIFRQLGNLLDRGGRIVSLVSSPEIYSHEWASFSTLDFPENRTARSGERVRIVVKDLADQRPVEDVVWSDEAYREVYGRAGLELLATYRPLANAAEPVAWISETQIAPWVIYVLQKAAQS